MDNTNKETERELIEDGSFTLPSNPLKVDRDKGIIFGVRLLGNESRNNVRYPEQTRKEALSLFQNIKVNLSHQKDRSASAFTTPTEFERRLGKITDVETRSDGTYGNLHYLTSHPCASRLEEAAEKMPELFGLSPVMFGRLSPPDAAGIETCVKILKVKSVDVVSDPGSNRSLFEDINMEPAVEPVAPPTPEKHLRDGVKNACMALFDDDKLDSSALLKRITDIIKAHKKVIDGTDEKEEDDKEKDDKVEDKKEDEKKDKEVEEQELITLREEKSIRLLCEEECIPATNDIVSLLLAVKPTARRTALLKMRRNPEVTKAPVKNTTLQLLRSK